MGLKGTLDTFWHPKRSHVLKSAISAVLMSAIHYSEALHGRWTALVLRKPTWLLAHKHTNINLLPLPRYIHTHNSFMSRSQHALINTWFTHGLGVLSCIYRCLPRLNDLSIFPFSVRVIWLCNNLTLTRQSFSFSCSQLLDLSFCLFFLC